MIAESKLDTLVQKIESVSHSLEELAVQEQQLLEQVEQFKLELIRDHPDWQYSIFLRKYPYWKFNFDQNYTKRISRGWD